MKYTDETEKKAVRKAFKLFLLQNDLNLSTFAFEKMPQELYWRLNQKINRDDISHEYIEGLAKLVQPSAKLEKFNNMFKITFKWKD